MQDSVTVDFSLLLIVNDGLAIGAGSFGYGYMYNGPLRSYVSSVMIIESLLSADLQRKSG